MKRVDSLSKPTKSFVFNGGGGIKIRPQVPKITAIHLTANTSHSLVERGSIALTKSHDYYGPSKLDPMGL